MGALFDKLPDSVHDHVVDQLVGRTWGEIEVLEHAGYLLFPEKLYKRNRKGGYDPVDICLRVPREHELRQARVLARQIALADNLDLDRDRDLVDDLEIVCILSLAIRNADPPHEPWVPDPRKLEETYDRSSLMQLWAKLDNLTQVLDPRPETISEEEMIALMSALSKERNLSPLLVYGSEAQTFCVVTMADRLLSSLASRSSSAPSEPSTPASSLSAGS